MGSQCCKQSESSQKNGILISYQYFYNVVEVQFEDSIISKSVHQEDNNENNDINLSQELDYKEQNQETKETKKMIRNEEVLKIEFVDLMGDDDEQGLNLKQQFTSKEGKFIKELMFSSISKDDSAVNDVSSIKTKTFKFSKDLFVQLKQGSIENYYERQQVLGQGAYGKVYKVLHKNTGLIRAMKQMKKSLLIQEEEKKLFAEMNILKNLDHPHIVKLYELFQDTQYYYLITEYLEGGELLEKIRRNSIYSEKKAAEYMRQILLAVNYCHEQNIVHRDLKPENIIFIDNDQNSKLKIIDFGTSRKFDADVKMTKKLGTPYYIAPEVLDKNYDEKCDIWSCGVILYILLCGQPPFTGRNQEEILEKVKSGKFQFDPDDWSMISKQAKNLIQEMLTYEPQKRPSAKQLLENKWFQQYAPSNQISKKALMNLSKFQCKSQLRQSILIYMINQIQFQKEKEELQKTFQSLDKNKDGLLSKQELLDGYKNIFRNQKDIEEKVENILKEVDIDQSGQIDFSEFILAAMNQEKLLDLENMMQTFKMFDEDKDGYITKWELENVFGSIDQEQWQNILDEVDKNQDGLISFQEFQQLLISK